jgi:integrase
MLTGEWEPAASGFARHLAASNASTGTVRLRLYWLGRLALLAPRPWIVTTDDLTTFLARPSWSAETRKSARATVTTFYAWAASAGHIGQDPAARLPRITVPRGRPRPAPELVVQNALGRADERATLMVQLAYLQGLRRGEVARLHSDDLVDDSLRIRGKGGVIRVLPLHPEVARRLHAIAPGWVFPGPHGHLSPDAVGRILSRHLGPGWSGHTLRHAAASRWYRNTRDIVAVRDLLGHASVATTQIYTATPDGALRAAVLTGGTAA